MVFQGDTKMIIKIDNEDELYKIDYIENVNFTSRQLVFTLSKYEG